jgi:hypothetical protein
MTTIVNTPAPENNSNANMGMMIIVLVVLLVLGYLFFVFGIPALKQIQLGSPQINIPNKIEVEVKQSK